jgi:hypothetical protein
MFFRHLFLNRWIFLLLILLFTQLGKLNAQNDECAGATILTVSPGNTCSNSLTTNTGFATQSFPSCVSQSYLAKDVWFKFVATATTHRITVTPTDHWDFAMQVYSGSCNNLTSIACVNNGTQMEIEVSLLKNLIIGNTYYIRVYENFANAATTVGFNICVNEATIAVDNDNCDGAININPVSYEAQNSGVKVNTAGATSSIPACFGTAEDDVWFKFTATSGRVFIQASANTFINPVIEVFTGSCGALTSVGCYYYTGSSYDYIRYDMTNAIPGVTYYYRIYGAGFNSARTTIITNVLIPGAVPVNDECAGAIPLTVNTGATCTNIYSGNTGYPTQSLPSCVPIMYKANDVWFKFIAIATSQRITVTPINYWNFVFQVYSGSCNNLTSIGCINTGSTFEPDIAVFNNLTIGNTYYLRVYDYYGQNSPGLNFTICVSTIAAAVDNDDCTGALNVIPVSTFSNVTVTANNTGATQSLPGCFGTAEDDIWFKFTATSTRHRINVSTNANISPVLEVFSGTCTSLSSLNCRYINDPQNSFVDADLTSLVIGNTYYYRVYGAAANNVRTNISTNITSPGPVPSNDECTGAISLTVNSGNTNTSIYSGNTGASTQSLPPCLATGYDAKDVWFKFVATSATQRIRLDPAASDNYVFQLFSGSCNSLASLGCVNTGNLEDPDIGVFNNLIPGNSYFIRVFDYYGGGSVNKQFQLSINEATTLIDNDDCSNALNITPSTTFSSSYVKANNAGATQSVPGCFGIAEDDIWFKFTSTAYRNRIVISTNEDINPVLEIFSGSCGNLISMGCSYINDGSIYFNVENDLSSFIPGNQYYLRVYGSSPTNLRTNILAQVVSFGSPLPVTWSSFYLQTEEIKNTLIWKTATEINNKGFEVQVSRNGNQYEALGFVESKAQGGYSTEPVQYTYEHAIVALPYGKIYYRLKQIDNDGQVKYSTVITSTILKDPDISISPNPVNDQILIQGLSTGKCYYSIKTYAGAKLVYKNLIGRKIDVGYLNPGIYILELLVNNQKKAYKFIKL